MHGVNNKQHVLRLSLHPVKHQNRYHGILNVTPIFSKVCKLRNRLRNLLRK